MSFRSLSFSSLCLRLAALGTNTHSFGLRQRVGSIGDDLGGSGLKTSIMVLALVRSSIQLLGDRYPVCAAGVRSFWMLLGALDSF